MAEGKTERHSARNMSREISCLRQIGQQRWIAVARWVDRQLQERYVTRLIKSAHKYRDPLSALQLKEIDDRFLLLRPGRLIVDFGCSPGPMMVGRFKYIAFFVYVFFLRRMDSSSSRKMPE